MTEATKTTIDETVGGRAPTEATEGEPSAASADWALPAELVNRGADLDIRLIALDMDGTLLDASGSVPEGFWAVARRLIAHGATIAPASGRQYATLHDLFAPLREGLTIIAENGALVMRDGVEVSSTTLDRDRVLRAVEIVRRLGEEGHDLGIVLGGKRAAHVERRDAGFVEAVGRYYHALEQHDDLASVDDDIVKLAIFQPGGVESGTVDAFEELRGELAVVVSSHDWIDVMSSAANKGAALRELARTIGATREQTAAFGDYLNDLEMLDAAGI